MADFVDRAAREDNDDVSDAGSIRGEDVPRAVGSDNEDDNNDGNDNENGNGSGDDSSEEEDEDDDEEAARKVREGFIVDDEEEEEVEDDEGNLRRRKKKKRKLVDEERDELDEDDLDLVAEATGRERPRDSGGNKLKRLKRRKEDREERADAVRAAGLDNMFDDDEDDTAAVGAELDDLDDVRENRVSRLEDEFADFIEEDDLDEELLAEERETRPPQPQVKAPRPRPGFAGSMAGIDEEGMQEVFELFGDGQEYEWALDGAQDDEGPGDMDIDPQDPGASQGGKKELGLKDVFEPEELKARMLTREDDIIRMQDEPERFQELRAGFTQPLISDSALDEETDWIFPQFPIFFEQIDPDWLTPHVRKAIRKVLEFLNVDLLEVPFIWAHRRDYLLFVEKDSVTGRFLKEHRLLKKYHLWWVLAMDTQYRAILEKKAAVQSLFQGLGVEDEMVEESTRGAETMDDWNDLSDYIHFRYAEQIRDSNITAGSTVRRPRSTVSLFDKIRNGEIYYLVRAFGLSAENFAVNVAENEKRFFTDDIEALPEVSAEQYVKAPEFPTAEAALKACRDMLSEEIWTNPAVRKNMQKFFVASVRVRVVPTEKGIRQIDEEHLYYKFKYLRDQTVGDLVRAPEQYLQMLQAETEGLVNVLLEVGTRQKAMHFESLLRLFVSDGSSEVADKWNEQRRKVLEEVFDKTIPHMVKNMKERVKTMCEDKLAMDVQDAFTKKLDQPPFLPRDSTEEKGVIPRVIAVSSGAGDFGKEATLVVYVDEHGQTKANLKLRDIRDPDARAEFVQMVRRYKPDVIGVAGWGVPTSRLFLDVRRISEEERFERCEVQFVDDHTARLYKESQRAKEDHADLPPLARYCVGLAKYLQSPLMEYAAMEIDGSLFSVKFHEYQDLLPIEKRKRAYECGFVDIVNMVGVMINDAARETYRANLLPFVAGLGKRKAQGLLKKIALNGGYLTNRRDLVEQRMAAQHVFLNCASFLRIPYESKAYRNDGAEALDATRIHPEDYELARKMAADALELDEEDLDEFEATGGVVAHLFTNKDDAKKLDELILEDYAEELEKAIGVPKRDTLDIIKDELMNPYAERRFEFLVPTAKAVFNMLTGETEKTFHEGVVVAASIKRLGDRYAVATLDNGVEGNISVAEMKDEVRNRYGEPVEVVPSQVFTIEQTVRAVVISIDYEFFRCELSTKESRVKQAMRDRVERARPRGEDWDEDAEAADRRRITAKRDANQRTARVIKHVLFHPFNTKQAEDYLAPLGKGDAVIRPSSMGSDHLVITWKIDENVYQHIDVLELEKDNEFSLGKILRIGNQNYSDLDEIIVAHVRAMARKAEELMAHEKYRGTPSQAEQWLNTYSEANPKRSAYCFSIDSQHPGWFILMFKVNPATRIQKWSVRLAPNAYMMQKVPYPDVLSLSNGFKRMYASQKGRGSRM
ncbi:transcription elongation factor Spt6 [Saitoella complicata NRRL Y-17804]|uniref:Transcription elongation factor Spt6 n=1 Tax=Saitoella complicata (strain BCRC 22490 / CBS 7301 / JCM 7358 / NBRC 10748 / NRRL Y-17804) TaxID=698492 RepID=A0A0E9NEA4_SAICN|nr:transcription elongation factor Spt6 [Saitoella complicata NRRL Y-17804]ODQ54644.1 transcription elongation factor Spt6 [Saitoella complicata NRRL Y-17804]GAO48026.1 hypothetical protein G7K_2214-t1 [Saitoella complicata NRRL Y-17804]